MPATSRRRPAVREDLRRNNLAAVVRHLHNDALSRADLALLTGLDRSTVSDLVSALRSAGLVNETPAFLRKTGRPSLIVQLDPERAWVLAVEISIEALTVARVGLGGAILQRFVEQRRRPSDFSPQRTAATIAAMTKKLALGAPPGARFLGVGVATPGIVRRDDGFVHMAPNLEWYDVPFGGLLTKKLPGSPKVVIANEADLGVLAECSRGCARSSGNVIYISGNTGVGAGTVVDGAPLSGRSGYAGEVGHVKVNPQGYLCHCGGRGCWEAEIGAAGLLRRAGGEVADVREGVAGVLADARAGKPAALAALNETAQWIGVGVANLVNIFNPDMVVFGGALRSVFLAAEAVVRNELRAHALPQAAAEVTVAGAGLGPDSVLFGAAELAFEGFLADPMAVIAGSPG